MASRLVGGDGEGRDEWTWDMKLELEMEKAASRSDSWVRKYSPFGWDVAKGQG